MEEKKSKPIVTVCQTCTMYNALMEAQKQYEVLIRDEIESKKRNLLKIRNFMLN